MIPKHTRSKTNLEFLCYSYKKCIILKANTFKNFDISFDIFHRTSSEIHHKTAQDFFKLLHDKGEFIKKTSEQYYDEEYNQFLADRYIKGTCPHCNNEDAYGDQCEKCGATLNPTDLINPKSTLSGNKPIMRSTFHWYLPMQNHEKWLTEWLKKGLLNDSIHFFIYLSTFQANFLIKVIPRFTRFSIAVFRPC